MLKPAQLSDGVWQSAQERSRIKQLLARIPHFKVHIAVGDYFAGIDGLARSYQTARDTLRRGMRQAPRKQVYFFEDYRLPVLLGSLADSWQADQGCAHRCRNWPGKMARGRCRRPCATISCRIVICIAVPKRCSFTPIPCAIGWGG